MRNENLDLAQSSGNSSGDSSPPTRVSAFTFDFGQSKTIDDLTTKFTSTLRSTKSSEVLSEISEEKSTASTSTSSSHNYHLLFPSTSKNILKYSSGEHISGDSLSSGTVSDDKKPAKESKLAKFLRRTQSAHDEQCAVGAAKFGGECSKEPTLEKIDDTEEETHTRKRNKGTDMKFRLGFLKRRHTEGTINSSSVRPPPEEAQKWANSFTDLMASKYGQSLFKAFLQREFSEENIEFWLAVESYRKSRQNKLNSKAQKIFNEFVTISAPKEVNLDALTREGLVAKMAQPTPTTFDQAQKRVQGLLEADAYSRFLKSELYMELLHPEKYQNPT